MSVTIIDVAKEANVSKSTVSLVINNSPNVKLETKRRVLEAIDKLGYVTNYSARSLTMQKTNHLGIITIVESLSEKTYNFDTETETFSQDVTLGIVKGLADTNYGVLTERVSVKESNENTIPALVAQNRVDGIFIVGGLFDDSFIEVLKKKNYHL